MELLQRSMDAMQQLGSASTVPCTGAEGRAGGGKTGPRPPGLALSLSADLLCQHKTDFVGLGLNCWESLTWRDPRVFS